MFGRNSELLVSSGIHLGSRKKFLVVKRCEFRCTRSENSGIKQLIIQVVKG